jgi:catechol 2,3-dioxygenase-like lactoylglutathione lyase family enzyme
MIPVDSREFSMAMALEIATTIRFHLSLNVSDLGRAIDFYRILFGTEPAKRRQDYAKFELTDPPLVLSLEPTPRAVGGPLNHLGFRLPDSAALVAMQERLERAGIRSQREEAVECCYARQTKFWVTDPDNTLWELYTLHEDIEHRGEGQTLEQMIPDAAKRPAINSAAAQGPVTIVYEHRMLTPVPQRLPHADASVDEVRLRGSLNMTLDVTTQQRLVSEAHRVLRPGGKVFAHTLVGERALSNPGLSGPAAGVQIVPEEAGPVHLLESAGFRNLQFVKFDAKPCFQRSGVEMREQQLEGFKILEAGGRAQAIYKGPFQRVVDDSGKVFNRGERVPVDAFQAESLRSGEWAGQFLVLEEK